MLEGSRRQGSAWRGSQEVPRGVQERQDVIWLVAAADAKAKDWRWPGLSRPFFYGSLKRPENVDEVARGGSRNIHHAARSFASCGQPVQRRQARLWARNGQCARRGGFPSARRAASADRQA